VERAIIGPVSWVVTVCAAGRENSPKSMLSLAITGVLLVGVVKQGAGAVSEPVIES
jgi:hypothetical protein